MRVRVLDLDGAVTGQPFMADLLDQGAAEIIEARDLAPKLRILASRSALRSVLRRLGASGVGEPEIVFVGSGDFHHLTYAFLQRVEEPLTVIHFDNHPDWVRFPRTVNCGSWVNRALELEHVRRVVTIGPCSDDLANPEVKTANLAAVRAGRLEVYAWQALPTRLWGTPVDGPGVCTHGPRLLWRNLATEPWSDFLEELCSGLPPCPLWITIDKDVLVGKEAVTNWDQGAMTLAHVVEAVATLAEHRAILGVDVCGDYSKPRFRDPFRTFLSLTDRPRTALPAGAEARCVNNAANRQLMETFRAVLS